MKEPDHHDHELDEPRQTHQAAAVGIRSDSAYIRVGTRRSNLLHLELISNSDPARFPDFALGTAGSPGGDETVFASGAVYCWVAELGTQPLTRDVRDAL
jgi:hypothetical protein